MVVETESRSIAKSHIYITTDFSGLAHELQWKKVAEYTIFRQNLPLNEWRKADIWDRDETEWKELLYKEKTNILDYILGLP